MPSCRIFYPGRFTEKHQSQVKRGGFDISNNDLTLSVDDPTSQPWLMNGVTVASDAWLPRVVDQQWQINAVKEINGDGNAEIIWRHTPTGDINVWFLNGISVLSDEWLPRVADQQWKLVGPR